MGMDWVGRSFRDVWRRILGLASRTPTLFWWVANHGVAVSITEFLDAKGMKFAATLNNFLARYHRVKLGA